MIYCLRKIKNLVYLFLTALRKFKSKGDSCVFGRKLRITNPHFISLGYSFIGDNVTIGTSNSGLSPISIGDNSMIAQNCIIIGGNHNFSRTDVPINQQGEGKQGPIIIGSDVWLGARCTVLTGVKIGNGAVIGSCAVVTKDLPPFSISVGNPAKIIGYRK